MAGAILIGGLLLTDSTRYLAISLVLVVSLAPFLLVVKDTPLAKAEYLGIYEDNDPSKRLQVIINYNNDIGDYMEWSGEGWYPVNFSNDAYKFATNYVMYGLTH